MYAQLLFILRFHSSLGRLHSTLGEIVSYDFWDVIFIVTEFLYMYIVHVHVYLHRHAQFLFIHHLYSTLGGCNIHDFWDVIFIVAEFLYMYIVHVLVLCMCICMHIFNLYITMIAHWVGAIVVYDFWDVIFIVTEFNSKSSFFAFVWQEVRVAYMSFHCSTAAFHHQHRRPRSNVKSGSLNP